MIAGVRNVPDSNGGSATPPETAAVAAETGPAEEAPASEEQQAGPSVPVTPEDAEEPAQADGDMPQPAPVALHRPATAQQV